MDLSMHCLVEESLVAASMNLGKNVIQQCLQQEVLPSDGTEDVLPGACQALAEAILRNVQLRIWEAGCVTQKEILSHACRELAMLIKSQCPRGPGEMVRMRGKLESVLSESSLAAKLAEVINTRELVECVCSRHEAGLGTVLLSACQWLLNDIKALLLCEEVWSNLFGDRYLVCAAFYTQIRPLLSTMVFQINLISHIEEKRCKKTENIRETEHKRYGDRLSCKMGTRNLQKQNRFGKENLQRFQNINQSSSYTFYDTSSKRTENKFKETKYDKNFSSKSKVDGYIKKYQECKIVIHNREHQISYIIEIINTDKNQECYTTIWKLWNLLIKKDVLTCNYMCENRTCYLVTYGRQPVNSLELLPLSNCRDNAFKTDVTIEEVGHPIWPKDKSVIKRWFSDPHYQAVEDAGDWGNQCLQIWKICSKKIEKCQPKIIDRIIGNENVNVRRHPGSSTVAQKSTGCFQFYKNKRKTDDF